MSGAVVVAETLPPPVPAVDPQAVREDEEWIARAPLAVLQCRDLRHAWPRQTAAPKNRPAIVPRRGRTAAAVLLPPNSRGVSWEVLEHGPPVVLRRLMLCTGRCGVRRVEDFVVRDGRLVRPGRPKLRYPAGYRRARPDPEGPRRDRLDPELVRGSIVHRLVPGLRW